ncbi:hypothetical protein PMIN01_10571 [Paraphaeosphaeria minitans]|uniref:Uncharacterized protein n=1 Tax=Paraphaeosphaeria minitans TaxID=565426 RepID=A0A9P6GC79_9PLEO|nr:hypothetical protein PMIN01_10571 [Paraphaeosphaeria minitans]
MSHNRKRSVEEPSSATNPIVISSDSYDDLADGPSYNDIADYPDFLDGPQISRASTEDEFRYRPDAPVTEDFGASSAPDNIGPCACKDSCAGRRRGRAKPCCALWGISCTPSCACAASATCHNIWDAATKARLFGALEGSVEPRPTACFASWYAARREGKKPPRRNWARSLANPSAKLDALPVAELDYTHLYEVVTKSHSFAESAEWNEGLCAFQDAVKEAGGATPEQAMRLVRFAFTEDRDLLV